MNGPRRAHPPACYAVVGALFAAQDCAKREGLPHFERLDLYAISGVRRGFDPPAASDALRLRPDNPRKTMPSEGGWIGGLQPAGAWTSELER